jgi:hypothetical protein
VIREATKAQASDIAQLIMMAMTDDCCQHFCGAGHGLEDCKHLFFLCHIYRIIFAFFLVISLQKYKKSVRIMYFCPSKTDFQ